MLRKTNKSDKASILQRNLFVALGSVEMIALARFMSIIHLSVSMPFRWLAGKTHELRNYDWGPMSMARVIDTLREKMSMIAGKPSLIHNETFMLDIFNEYRDELPPFQEYWDEIFTQKKISVVNRKSGTKELQFDHIRKVLWRPTQKADKQAKKQMTRITGIGCAAVVKEIDDEKKTTYKYSKASKSEFSWAYYPAQSRKDMLQCKATNDDAESALGGTTHQVQRFGRITVAAAGAIGDAWRNRFLHRPTAKKDKAKGMFHQFDEILRYAIVEVAMKDTPKTRAANDEAMKLQQKAKQARENIKKEANM